MNKLTDEELTLIIADTKSRIELADVPTQFYPSYIHRLATELQALRQAQRWQPIETAPKDGKKIILFAPDAQPFTAQWNADNYGKVSRPFWCRWGVWGKTEDRDLSARVTHWQPLPSAPERSQP